MNEDNLEVTLREATNGWIVEFNKFGETIEYIFTRPNPAISLVRKETKDAAIRILIQRINTRFVGCSEIYFSVTFRVVTYCVDEVIFCVKKRHFVSKSDISC